LWLSLEDSKCREMTFGILIFPGAYGDKELIRVIEDGFGQKVRAVWNKETSLDGIDVLFIPGGFPCKGSSKSSSLRDSPLIEPMIEYVRKGRILVGIGNGFRVLCETGLLPGEIRMNRTQRFICKQTFIKPDNDYTAITSKLSNSRAYQIPIATGYGRYTAKDDTLIRMRHQDQILFRYCDANGRISEEINVTGSVDNIAGVCNEKKNIFGMIPQPERAVFALGGNTDGKDIFSSLIDYI